MLFILVRISSGLEVGAKYIEKFRQTFYNIHLEYCIFFVYNILIIKRLKWLGCLQEGILVHAAMQPMTFDNKDYYPSQERSEGTQR